MVKMKMFKMLTVYLSLSLILLGCTSTVNKEVSSAQSISNQSIESPKVEIVKTGTSDSVSSKPNLAKGMLMAGKRRL